MNDTRQQLSMFVPKNSAKDIEQVRLIVDAIQSHLIPAHITLCREDELLDIVAVLERLRHCPYAPLELRFGEAERFSSHGLMLPCIEGADAFHRLRAYLLDTKNIMEQRPHITLAHPRNPKSPENSLELALSLPSSMTIRFATVTIIEQQAKSVWKLCETIALHD